jgi:hypothetical protein
MKIKLVLILAMLTFAFPMFAQDDNFEDYQFDDSTALDEAKQPYFALALGGTASFLFANYDDINAQGLPSNLHWDNFYGEDVTFSGPTMMWGFDVFTALSPLLNNTRLGISYKAGSQEISQSIVMPDTPLNDILDFNVYRSLEVNMAGLHIDYAFVPIKSLAIVGGMGLHLGNMYIEQARSLPTVHWNDTGITTGNSDRMHYSFIGVEPQVSVEYALTGFLMLRLHGSYIVSFDNPFVDHAWTINGNNELTSVPSSVSPNGFNVGIGLYLGLFNY